MRAPAFWWHEQPEIMARLLSPFGSIYGAIAARRMNRPGFRARMPVLCVGNFVAGGAGKTPTALAIAAILAKDGEKPALLTRGYGSAASRRIEPTQVDTSRDDAFAVGDEALLLARMAPTFVGADRPRLAEAAIAAGAGILILDDGLQNPSLTKDFALAVVDGATGAGNGLCIPAGPLRADLAVQLAHVDAVVVLGKGAAGEKIAGLARKRGIMVFAARLAPSSVEAEKWRGRRVVAFAGIGRPQKFFATLEQAGADIVERHSFADHHVFSQAEMETLRRQAADHNALLVTTEKDLARLPADGTPRPMALPVEITFEDEAKFRAALTAAIAESK